MIQNLATQEQIDNKADKTTTVTHTASTAVGSTTQPVYINSSGVATATSYSLAKSVPSNAVFTDTNTWRGIQNNLTSTSTTDSLAAAQGKALNDKITTINTSLGKCVTYNSSDDYLYIGTTKYMYAGLKFDGVIFNNGTLYKSQTPTAVLSGSSYTLVAKFVVGSSYLYPSYLSSGGDFNVGTYMSFVLNDTLNLTNFKTLNFNVNVNGSSSYAKTITLDISTINTNAYVCFEAARTSSSDGTYTLCASTQKDNFKSYAIKSIQSNIGQGGGEVRITKIWLSA